MCCQKSFIEETSSTALTAKHFSATNVSKDLQTMSSKISKQYMLPKNLSQWLMSQKISRQYVLPKIFHGGSKLHCVDSETFLSATNVSKHLHLIFGGKCVPQSKAFGLVGRLVVVWPTRCQNCSRKKGEHRSRGLSCPGPSMLMVSQVMQKYRYKCKYKYKYKHKYKYKPV